MRDDIYSRVGCICCHIDGHGWVAPEWHHCRILGGKRVLTRVLPLCPRCHRTGAMSLHRAKKSFREKYGSEEELLKLVDQRIAEIRSNTIGG